MDMQGTPIGGTNHGMKVGRSSLHKLPSTPLSSHAAIQRLSPALSAHPSPILTIPEHHRPPRLRRHQREPRRHRLRLPRSRVHPLWRGLLLQPQLHPLRRLRLILHLRQHRHERSQHTAARARCCRTRSQSRLERDIGFSKG